MSPEDSKFLKCASCGHNNKPVAKFCASCGGSLAPMADEPPAPSENKCHSCGYVNPPGNKFCAECGKSLIAADEPAAEDVPVQKPAPHARKKYRRKKKSGCFVFLKWMIPLILIVAVILAYMYGPGVKLSADQTEIVAAFGHPQEFIIAYLPADSGEDMTLIRHDIWFYPEHEARIVFVGGEIMAGEDAEAFDIDFYDEEFKGLFDQPEITVTYSNLKPEDFHFNMGYDEIAELVEGDIVEVSLMADLLGEGSKMYMADNVVFTIAEGHMIYMQTLGYVEE